MYRLKGKQGILIHPTFQAHATTRHSLRGYGENDKAELETYLFHIPQQATDYPDFVSKMAASEELLRKHLQTTDISPISRGQGFSPKNEARH